MEQKLLSVIVPVYNAQGTLDRCLESLTGQTYQKLEILLVDDGSVDGSRRLCESWKVRDRRIALSGPKANEGLSEARNIGMRMSHGRYLAFLDSDDYLEKDAYEKMITAMERDGSDFSICNFWNCKEANGQKEPAYRWDNRCVANMPEELFLEHFPTAAWCKVLKREVMFPERKAPLWFPVGRRYEDTVVSFQQASMARSVSAVGEPLYYYVQGKDTITAKPRLQDVEDLIQNTHEIRALFGVGELETLMECYITGTLAFALQLFYRSGEKNKEVKKKILSEIQRSARKIPLAKALQSKRRDKILPCKAGLIDWAVRIHEKR